MKCWFQCQLNLLETLLRDCLLWQPWECTAHVFFRESLLQGVRSADSLRLQHLWGPLSFPAMAMLFRSRIVQANTGPLFGHSAPQLPVGLADFPRQSYYLSLFPRWAMPHGLGAFYAFCCHFPLSFTGIILNTSHISHFVLAFDF